MTEQNNKNNLSAVSLGLNMAVGMGVFSYLGYKIDQRQSGNGMWSLIGIFLGLLYCAYEVWKIIKQNKE